MGVGILQDVCIHTSLSRGCGACSSINSSGVNCTTSGVTASVSLALFLYHETLGGKQCATKCMKTCIPYVQDIGEPSVTLQLHRTNPITWETTPVTFTLSQEKFRLLLRG